MVKNIIIAILIVVALGEGFFLIKQRSLAAQSQQATAMQMSKQSKLPPAGPNAKRKGGRPIILTKGMNLKTTPVFKYAYQIAPGNLSPNAKKALIGWKIATTKQTDGTLTVSLTPTDSEDQSQQYVVKSGNTLYFIEQIPFDDKANQDKDLNYRDDYGVIVDKNGIIQ